MLRWFGVNGFLYRRSVVPGFPFVCEFTLLALGDWLLTWHGDALVSLVRGVLEAILLVPCRGMPASVE